VHDRLHEKVDGSFKKKRENVNDDEIPEDNGGIPPEKADKFPIFSVLQFEPHRYMLKAKL